MKIIKFIKKNYKRLIIQVVSIVSAFVIFSFSASANTFDYSIDMPISHPTITDFNAYVEVLYNNGVSGEVYLLHYATTSIANMRWTVRAYDDHVTIGSQDGGFQLIWLTSTGNVGYEIGGNENAGGPVTIYSNNIIGVKFYGSGQLISYLSHSPVSWNFNYSTDAISKNQLNTIIGLLQSQNSSNNQINESIEQSADKISGSISESTNEIINGGSDKPEVDSSGVDKHNETEQQITEATQNGITSAKDMFKQDHLKIFQGFGNGLMGVSEVINSFVSWPWLGDIIDLSMIFGMFAFIVGMSLMVMGSQRGKK